MIAKRFMISLLLCAAFLVPSLGQAWSFIDSKDTLNKSADSCWQIVTVQDTTESGSGSAESGSTELPPEEDEEPDCE